MKKDKKLVFDRTHFRFSKEQKIKIVKEIEAGQLTRKEAMEKYNIVGHQTLNSWLIQFSSNPADVVKKQYKKADQRLAALKIINGEDTVDQTARTMKVSVGTVTLWVRKFKNEVPSKPSTPSKSKTQEVSRLSKDQQKELEELRLKVAGLEMLIDIAEKNLKIDIRKKSGTKL
jgi:transposase